MCGRFALTASADKLENRFKLKMTRPFAVRPRFNIAPSQPVLAVVEDPVRKFEIMQWGLVPSWSKDPFSLRRMINARRETLFEKPTFKGLIKTSRCLIPADGFYEWQTTASAKQPFFIRPVSGETAAFAGLWSHWTGRDGSEIVSCTIITQDADEFMKPIHDRMPVVIREEDYDVWLSRSCYRPLDLDPIFGRSRRLDGWESYPVSAYVNAPTHDDIHCLERV